MTDYINKVLCGSATELDGLPDEVIDLIFTSPPYEKLRHYSDNPEDLGNYQGKEFVNMLKPILAECLRTLKPTGSLFLNFQAPNLGGFTSPSEYLIPHVAVEELGFQLVQTHYWVKPNAMPTPAAKVVKDAVEVVWHFAKGKDFFVNKDALRVPSTTAEKDNRPHKFNPQGKDAGNAFFELVAPDQQHGHPAKMPLPVAERFILYGSKAGDVVLDPFCGSGTTLVAAKKHGRAYVGYEMNPAYADFAREALGGSPDVVPARAALEAKRWLNMDELVRYTGLAKATIYSKVC